MYGFHVMETMQIWRIKIFHIVFVINEVMALIQVSQISFETEAC